MKTSSEYEARVRVVLPVGVSGRFDVVRAEPPDYRRPATLELWGSSGVSPEAAERLVRSVVMELLRAVNE